METSLMRHSKAIAASTANSTAFLFNTGNAPGSPRQTGHTFVFGGSPKRVEQEQKIFEAVSSCTWTSSPMTGSYLAMSALEISDVVAIRSDYSGRAARAAIKASSALARLGIFPAELQSTSTRYPSHPLLR